jgi:putrescine transport system permease protein
MKPGTTRTFQDRCVLGLGFAFIYLPILVLIVFSFTDSRLVTIWGGFSLRWYNAVWSNAPLLESVRISLIIATASASIATILGTLAALALARARPSATTATFSAIVFLPMVLPEVVLGLAFLLLFVAIGLDRGVGTIILAHATFSIAFVTVVVQSKLSRLDHSLEEAAMDLGCTPVTAFVNVTLPLIMPALLTGFLLAFTLSLDDLVVASFTSGPGATTLPMRIYSQTRLGVTPEINAICAMLIGIVTLVVIVVSVLAKRGVACADRH